MGYGAFSSDQVKSIYIGDLRIAGAVIVVLTHEMVAVLFARMQDA